MSAGSATATPTSADGVQAVTSGRQGRISEVFRPHPPGQTVAVLMVAVLLLAACGGQGAVQPSGGTTPAAATTAGSAAPSSGPLKLAQVNAMTGQSAVSGLAAMHGVEIIAAQINAAGGFKDSCGGTHTIQLSDFDMANSGEQAIAGLRQAASDSSILAVIGGTTSVGYLPMVPVAEQLSIPLVSPGSAAMVAKWNAWAFRVNPTTASKEPALLQVLTSKLGLRTAGLIYDITADDQRNGANIQRDSTEKFGYKVAAFESLKAGDTDFRPQLTTIKNSGAQWVGISAVAPEMAKIINQMSELQMLQKTGDPAAFIFVHSGLFLDEPFWDLTAGKVKGAVSVDANVDLASSEPRMKTFVADYTKKYGIPPTANSVFGAQALQTIIDGVTRSCTVTDRGKLRDALGNTKISVLGGKVSFTSTKGEPNGENLAAELRVFRVTGKGVWTNVQ